LVIILLTQRPVSIVMGLIKRIKARASRSLALTRLLKPARRVLLGGRLTGAVKDCEATAKRGHEVASFTVPGRHHKIVEELWYRQSRHQSSSKVIAL
jgi:hypothetical protein